MSKEDPARQARSRPGRGRWLAALLAGVLAAAGGAGWWLWPPPERVVVVYPRRNLMFAGHIGVVLEHTDIFAQNGIDARFQSPESHAAFIEAAHDADVVLLDQTQALLLAAQGDGRIVANLGSAGKLGLVVPSSSPVEEVSQLRGKRIASSSGGPAHRFLLEQLRGAGLGDSDWTHEVDADQDLSLELAADAAVIRDPALMAAEFQGQVRTIAASELFATVLFDRRLSDRHREVGLATLTAIKQAFHQLNRDPRQVAVQVAGVEGKPAPQVQRSCYHINGNFGHRQFVNLVLSPELPSFQQALRADNAFLVATGQLDAPAALDALVDGSLMDQVDVAARPLAVVGAVSPGGGD
jgi:ABC-type nitrate/sulfonate/bicarbonate transport system substrate-binding protein